MDVIVDKAIEATEQAGIVFIDEFDKIAEKNRGGGPDVSREGVQRDILPIVEGATVNTKYGPVKTDHILFIAAGAFHVSKPSDLIPELQGRFPIRVELQSLTVDDFRKILTEPNQSLVKQYTSLLSTDGVELEFTDDGIDAIADHATASTWKRKYRRPPPPYDAGKKSWRTSPLKRRMWTSTTSSSTAISLPAS